MNQKLNNIGNWVPVKLNKTSQIDVVRTLHTPE